MRYCFAPAPLGLLLLLWAPLQEQETPFDARGVPKGMREDAVLTARRCTTCHSIKRVLRADYEKDEWVDSVEVMAAKEKAGISPSEVRRISAFLVAWSGTSEEAHEETPDPVATLGGQESYPPLRHAVSAQESVPADADLPVTLTLGGTRIEILEIEAKEGPSVVVRGRVAQQSIELGLGRKGDGKIDVQTHELRRWQVGPRNFRLVVALYTVGDAVTSEDRPAISVATLVVRD